MCPDEQTPRTPDAEAQVLLCLASVGGGTAQADRLRRIIEGGVDWKLLLDLAHAARLRGRLHERLRAECPDLVPPEVAARLEAAANRLKLFAMHLTGELAGLLEDCRAEGIEVIPYKGPILAARLYDDPTARHLADLDVIVRSGDVARIKAVLEARDYLALHPMSAEQERAHMARDCELAMRRARDGAIVEIHWDVMPRFLGRSDVDVIWQWTTETELAGRPALDLRAEMLALVLSVHGGFKHEWTRLKWLGDIARLIECEPNLDFETLAALARSQEHGRTLGLGLYLARVLLDAPVPDAVFDPLCRDEKIVATAALTRARMFRADFALPGFSEWHAVVRRDFTGHGESTRLARSRSAARWAYLRAIMRPGWNDLVSVPVPKALRLLHYAIRPLRLLAQHRLGLFTRLR